MDIFGAEVLGLFLDVFDQLGSVDAFRETGEILDQRGERELPARLMACNDKGFQIGARGIDCGRVSGAARPDDYEISHGIPMLTESRVDELTGFTQCGRPASAPSGVHTPRLRDCA